MRELVITAILIASAATAAQQLPPRANQATGTGAITGRVVDAGTNTPVAGARLWMHQTRGDLANLRSEELTTDSSGTFSFIHLPVGEFSILAHADGYQPGAIGKRRPEGDEAWITLKDGQAFSGATIELFRGGTISGIVTNDRGEPMKEVHVGTWLRTSSGQLTHRHGGTTDDSGMYRMTAVPPGDHFVVAHVWHDTMRQGSPVSEPSPCSPLAPPPPEGTPGASIPPPSVTIAKPKYEEGEWFVSLPHWIPEPSPDDRGQRRTIPTVIYPGVPDVSDATVVSVRSGEDRGSINLRFEVTPSATVSGKVVPLPGGKVGRGSEVRLRLPGTPAKASEYRTWVQPDHTFRFLAVRPASYVLELELQEHVSCDVISQNAEDVLTQMPIEVPPGGLEEVVVHVASGRTMQGQIRFEGKAPRPESMEIWLRPTLDDHSPPADWDGDARIMAAGLISGSYGLSVSDNSGPAWFVRSMTLGPLDLVTHPMVVERDDVDGVQVTMTDRPSPLGGRIVDTTGKAVRDATVVAYPVDRASWLRAHDYLAGFASTRSLDGTYRFAHLVPGDYFVAAVDERSMGNWPHAEFLQAITTRGALRVRIVHGESRTVRLSLQAR